MQLVAGCSRECPGCPGVERGDGPPGEKLGKAGGSRGPGPGDGVPDAGSTNGGELADRGVRAQEFRGKTPMRAGQDSGDPRRRVPAPPPPPLG